jgi:hypothetical protein
MSLVAMTFILRRSVYGGKRLATSMRQHRSSRSSLVNEVSLGQRPAAGGAAALIKIQLRNGRSLKVPADIERKTLSSLIACVEAA